MDTGEHLQALELELLSRTTRKDALRVASLLADTFREFGSSGTVYTKDEIIRALLDEQSASISQSDFEVSFLAATVALVTYRSKRWNAADAPSQALRSSIWVEERGTWRIVFHQGTKLP